MKFIKGPFVTHSWENHKDRCMEYDIEFRVSIPRHETTNNINSVSNQAIQLLMSDPRRSESFPIFGNSH